MVHRLPPQDSEYERVVMKVSDIADPDISLGQRLPHPGRVKDMAKHYNPALVRPPVVAKVKGRVGYHPADGGHTIAMFKELNMDVIAVDLHKRELTKEEFAALVARLNTERRALTAWEKFHSQRLASEDAFPAAHALDSVLKDFKFKADDVKASIGDLLRMTIDGGPDRLRDVFNIISESFDGEGYAFRNSIPRALGDFFGRYGPKVNRAHLVKRLKGYNIVSAAANALSTGIKRGGTAGARFTILAEAIKRRYNTSRPAGVKRLRMANEKD